jgi:hypothetical protein
MPKDNPPRSCASLQKDKKKKNKTRAKEVTVTREQVVLFLNEGKTSSLYMIS